MPTSFLDITYTLRLLQGAYDAFLRRVGMIKLEIQCSSLNFRFVHHLAYSYQTRFVGRARSWFSRWTRYQYAFCQRTSDR